MIKTAYYLSGGRLGTHDAQIAGIEQEVLSFASWMGRTCNINDTQDR
jgi:hypothetical protein